MGRFTQNLNDTLEALEERKRVLAMPREEYLFYITEHPDFKSSDAQVSGDAELLTMKVVAESLGRDAAIEWVHRRYWKRVDKRWRAENIAANETRLTAFGFTLLFNGAKLGAVCAIAYLALPTPYFAAFAPVACVATIALALCAATMRRFI